MVSVLDIKVTRDLRAMWTQVLSIALLIAAGTAVLVMSLSNYRALVSAMQSHYRNEAFADVFAGLKRAPLAVAERVREVDGLAVVEARISQPLRVIRPDSEMPLSGRLVSIPDQGQPDLNRLVLTKGRWIEAGRLDEVIVNEAFARARGIEPGDTIDVVLNGRMQPLRIAGLALSPEFVFATRSALPLPDDRNYVVVWASRTLAAGAFDMTGAFNDLVMRLAPGSIAQKVIEDVDRLLEPFGGTGAYERSQQASHRFLEDELGEQETVGIVMPAVFFAIAAFLLNVVVGRLIDAQREQIAALRALGYPRRPIVLHYFKLVSSIAVLGVALGLLVGRWLADLVIESYRAFFRFPTLDTVIDPWVVGLVVVASLASSNSAAAVAIWRLARLTPAEAMRPPAPRAGHSAHWFAGDRVRRWSVPSIMAIRTLLGRPVRSLLTIVGIALAVPLVLFGLFWFDAIAAMLDISFERIERGDAVVTFTAPVPAQAVFELRSMPGVLEAEGQRAVPVRLVAGHRSYRTALTGLEAGSTLRILRTSSLAAITIPSAGMLLSRQLADRLGVARGDMLTVQVLDAKRREGQIRIEALSDDILGYSATMDIAALNRFLGEGEVINLAALRLDPARADEAWHRIARAPRIEASSAKALWLKLFDESIAGMILVAALVLAGFGLLITFGIVYNSARIALQERAWELASLRILGFTRAEVSRLLLSEIAFEVAVAIPFGLAFGRWLIGALVTLRLRESFQIPIVIEPESYAIATIAVITATAISAYAVHRRIDRLDLVTTLKTRD